MGDVYLDMTVINDSDPNKQMEIQFLADTVHRARAMKAK